MSSYALKEPFLQACSTSDGWTDDLQFYVLFNSISVISGQWEIDNETLCAVEKILPRAGMGFGPLDQ